MSCPKYLLKDNLGNVGQTLPLIRGESRTVTVFLKGADGAPLVYSATLAELVVKVYSNVSSPSIQKLFSATHVTPLTSTELGGIFGFQFQLLPADTAIMAANNSGLPMSAIFTDSTGNVTEYDFIAAFDVSLSDVQT